MATKRKKAAKPAEKKLAKTRVEFFSNGNGKFNYRLRVEHAGDNDILYATVQGFEPTGKNSIGGIRTNIASIKKALSDPNLQFVEMNSRRGVTVKRIL